MAAPRGRAEAAGRPRAPRPPERARNYRGQPRICRAPGGGGGEGGPEGAALPPPLRSAFVPRVRRAAEEGQRGAGGVTGPLRPKGLRCEFKPLRTGVWKKVVSPDLKKISRGFFPPARPSRRISSAFLCTLQFFYTL